MEPIIWNLKLPDHSKKDKVMLKWMSIHSNLKKEFGDELVERLGLHEATALIDCWNSLRNSFMRLLRGQTAPSGSGLKPKEPKWHFYEAMKFVKDGSAKVTSHCSFQETSSTFGSLAASGDCELPEDASSGEGSSTNMSDKSEFAPWSPKDQIKRRKKDHSITTSQRDFKETCMVSRRKKFLDSLHTIMQAQQPEAEDEDSQFVKYLATQLKKIRAQNKFHVHKELLKVLDAELHKQETEEFLCNYSCDSL